MRPKVHDMRINIYMPEAYWKLSKKLGSSRGVSTSEIVRRALKQYLVQEYKADGKTK